VFENYLLRSNTRSLIVIGSNTRDGCDDESERWRNIPITLITEWF